MATCRGTPENHCCWVAGQVCPYYDPAVPDRGCTLRAELGSWQAVTVDARWVALGIKPGDRTPKLGCGGFPRKGRTCHSCGVSG